MEFFEPADIVIYIQGKGIMLKEKSLLAIDIASNKIIAFGKDVEYIAQHHTDNIKIISPIRRGAIVDYAAAVSLFSHLLLKACEKKPLVKAWVRQPFCRQPMAVCVPKGITDVEKKAVEEAVYQAGAKEVFIADIPVEQLLKEIPFLKKWQKVKIFIGITKDEPERYIEEQFLDILCYAQQEGISIEKVKDLFQEIVKNHK